MNLALACLIAALFGGLAGYAIGWPAVILSVPVGVLIGHWAVVTDRQRGR